MREQGPTHRTLHKAKNLILLPKTDFGLGRVHVHIHRMRVDLQEERCQRVPPDHQHGVVGLCQRGVERDVINIYVVTGSLEEL